MGLSCFCYLWMYPICQFFPPGILFVIAYRASIPYRLCQFDSQIPATELPQAHFCGKWLESLQCTVDSNEKEAVLTFELRQWPFPWKVLCAHTTFSQWRVSTSRARWTHFLNFDIKVHGVNLSNLLMGSSPLVSLRLIHKALFCIRTWSACFPQPRSDTLLELSWVDVARGWYCGGITESAHVGSVPDGAPRHWFVLTVSWCVPLYLPCLGTACPQGQGRLLWEDRKNLWISLLCNCNLNILYGVAALTSPGPTS